MTANQIDNRFAAESASFDHVANKDRAKQNKELLHLASVLRGLEHEVAGAKDGGLGATEKKGEKGPKVVNLNAQQSQGPQGPKNRFEAAMTELALMLQMLQVDIVKFQRNKTNDETDMSTAMISLYKSIAHDIEKKIEQVAKKKKQEKVINFWTKIAEAVVTAIVVGIALAFGQVEIAALVIVMYAVSASGLLSKAEKALAPVIAKLLKDFKAHGKWVKLASEIIATVLIMAAIGGVTYFLAPEDLASEAVNAGEEIAEDAEDSVDAVELADIGGEETPEVDETSQGQETKNVSKLRQLLRKLRLPTKYNMMIMSLSQSITQMNIPQTVVDGMQINRKLSEKQKEEIEMIVSVIVAIMALLASIGSGDALADAMGEGEVKGGTSMAAKLLGKVFGDVSETALGQMLNRISKVLEELSGMKAIVWMERFRRVVATGEAGLQAWEGKVILDQANLDELLGKDQAAMDLTQAAVNSNSSEQSDSQKQMAATLKEQRMSDKNLDLFAGEKALARVLTTQSPV